MDDALAPCQFKLGELAPACAQPARNKRHLTLPEFVAEGVMIAADQRELDLDVCDEHARFMDQLSADPSAKLPAAARNDLPVPASHTRHTAWTADCLGCSLDYAPPW